MLTRGHGALHRCAVGSLAWAMAIAYSDSTGEIRADDVKPTTLEDFFDIERFPGRRGLRRTPMANLEWALLAHERRQLLDDMSETFRETFGADATIVDAPLQMRRNVARLRHAAGVSDDADFSPLLEKFSGASGSVSGGTLRTLRYDDGRLDIEMTLAGTAALDTLRRRIAEGAPLAARWHKKFIRRLADPRPLSAEEFDESYACFDTEDFREGVAAFLAQRKPGFKGK